ncbi:hypothetical protein [Arthrobacter sp. PsM3]|nr:hypothetical protein [Arthrobacter sp. PsM3]MDN4643452.1 hypothetical protein [Arthrobacter sp. PsM3]
MAAPTLRCGAAVVVGPEVRRAEVLFFRDQRFHRLFLIQPEDTIAVLLLV